MSTVPWKRLVYGSSLRRTLIRAAVIGAVLFAVGSLAYTPCYIDGESMAPTYQDRGVNIIDRLKFRFREPRRGDVVVIPAVERRNTFYLKRVLAVKNCH